jgi:hypothetical protein
MSERQSHGFKFETKWCKENNVTLWSKYIKKYGNPSGSSYTSKWDAINENVKGKNYKGKPIQLKCIGLNNAIELGDIFRNSNKEEDFTLVVGFWSGKKTNIVDVVVLDINHKKWNKLFEWDKFDEVKDWIKNKVSNDRSYDSQWKKEMSYYKEQWGENRLVTPTFKRDHKKQRRIQCQMGYNTFMTELVNNKICK